MGGRRETLVSVTVLLGSPAWDFQCSQGWRSLSLRLPPLLGHQLVKKPGAFLSSRKTQPMQGPAVASEQEGWEPRTQRE